MKELNCKNIMLAKHNPKQTKEFRKDLRKKLTQAETFLWSKLQRQASGYKFRRQHGIGNYIADFYCFELKLVIELDGITHLLEDVYKKDLQKQKFLEDNGCVIKRYNDSEVLKNIDGVMNDLLAVCKKLDNQKIN